MELRAGAASAILVATIAAGSAGAASAHPKDPRVGKVRCVYACDGLRRAAAGSEVRWTGHHLARVLELRFPAAHGHIGVAPISSARQSVRARVPKGATGGRPVLVTGSGATAHARKWLTIVAAGDLPGKWEFDLLWADASPKRAFFDGGRIRLRYRFRARSRRDVKINIVRRSTGAVVRHLTQRSVTPYSRHGIGWDGLRSNGAEAPDGSYAVRIGRPGRHGQKGARLRLLSAEFPVRGPHSYGGPVQRFGAPRSGGRVHQGQDIFASCGTREVAARGGRVQATGYDPQLYGNWLVIDDRAGSFDYRYAHLASPTPLHAGERVLTGQTVGTVGKTGNARTVGCMLHFEEWPHGWMNGQPVDPLPDLLRWDGWS